MELHEFIEKHRYGVDNLKTPSWGLLDYLPFEKDFYNHILNNKLSIIKKSRQMHVTTMLAGYVAWRLINNKDEDEVTYLTNRYDSSKHFIGKVRGILEEYGLTKDDFDVNNKKEINLKNGNRVLAVSSSVDSLRGFRPKCVIIDEAAFIDNFKGLCNVIIPNIYATNGQIIIASTPNGINFFHGLYSDSITGKNKFKVLDLIYHMHPKRDSEWFDQMSKMLNYNDTMIKQEILAEFIITAEKPKNKSNVIQVRLDDDMMRKLGVKLIENDNSVSEYIRKLINKDIS